MFSKMLISFLKKIASSLRKKWKPNWWSKSINWIGSKILKLFFPKCWEKIKSWITQTILTIIKVMSLSLLEKRYPSQKLTTFSETTMNCSQKTFAIIKLRLKFNQNSWINPNFTKLLFITLNNVRDFALIMLIWVT